MVLLVFKYSLVPEIDFEIAEILQYIVDFAVRICQVFANHYTFWLKVLPVSTKIWSLIF